MRYTRRTVALIYLGVSLLALVIGGIALSTLSATVRRKHELVRAYEEVARSADQLATLSERRARALRGGLLLGARAAAWTSHDEAREGFERAFTALTTGQGGPYLRAELAQIERVERRLRPQEDRLRAMQAAGLTPAPILGALVRDVLPIRDELDEAVVAAVHSVEAEVAAIRAESERDDARALALLTATCLFAVLIIAVLAQVLRATLGRLGVSQEALREASEFQRQVMGVVGHDLRSPLTAIRMTAQAMGAMEGVPEAFERSRARIVRSATRMERIAGLLLDLTRLHTARGIPVAPQPGELHTAVGHILDEARAEHPTRRIDHRQVGDGRGEFDGDRIAQVVANLLDNAIKYSPAGSTVDVVTTGLEDALLLEVHNDGTIAPDVLPRIFDAFSRGASGGSRFSAGLGLFVSRELVEAHGGTIEVRSLAGAGTTFRVRLPRRATR